MKNGPPYPLDEQTHKEVVSGDEKKAKKQNWKAAVETHKKELKDFENSELSKEVNETWKRYHSSVFDPNVSAKDHKKIYEKYKRLKTKYDKQKDAIDKKYEAEEKLAYRDWMASKDPGKADFYKNCSDEELNADIAKKQRTKKILIGAGIAVGVAAAAYLVYRHNVIQQAKGDEIHKALKEQLVDMDVVLDKDSPLQRIVGTPDFDLSKVGKDGMYASFTKGDSAIYKGLLKVRTGGRRYAVGLKTTKEVRVAGEKTLEEIFDKLYNDPNSNYKKELAETLRSKTFFGQHLTDEDILNRYSKDPGGLFGKAMYTLVLKGPDSKTFFKACEDQNYDAILDLFDRKFGGMSDISMEAPLIFLNPQNALVKTGEKAVDIYQAQIKGMKIYELFKKDKGVYQDVFWKFVNRK